MFAKHLLDNEQAVDPIEDVTDILHITDNGRNMNVIARYYLYLEWKNCTKISDWNTVTENEIFSVIIRYEDAQMTSSHSNNIRV
jgi:hypothetical protein